VAAKKYRQIKTVIKHKAQKLLIGFLYFTKKNNQVYRIILRFWRGSAHCEKLGKYEQNL
jgi:hypothetical protein